MIIIKEFDFYISEIVDAIEIRCDANLVNLIQPDLICLFKRENNFVHFWSWGGGGPLILNWEKAAFFDIFVVKNAEKVFETCCTYVLFKVNIS